MEIGTFGMSASYAVKCVRSSICTFSDSGEHVISKSSLWWYVRPTGWKQEMVLQLIELLRCKEQRARRALLLVLF